MPEPTPLRPDEQVAGGYLYITLAGTPYELAVLPMRDNRQWVAKLRAAVLAVVNDTDKLDTIEDFIDLLASNSEVEMDLLIAYDQLGAKVLPDRDTIDATATDLECYRAIKQVAAAAFPKGPDLLRIVPELMPMLMQAVQKGAARATIAMSLSRRMSSAPPSTAGQPTTSSRTSPTSSSSATSKRPRKGSGKRTSVN